MITLSHAIEKGRHMGFRQLFDEMKPGSGEEYAWQLCLRAKQGLANPGKPGVYAKAGAYWRGYQMVRDWLNQGHDISFLYVGAVGLHHPVEEWVKEGLVKLQPVPELW